MAQWILRGEPEHDLWAFDVRRFGPHHASRRYLAERSVEAYGALLCDALAGRGGALGARRPALAAAPDPGG